MNLNVNDPFTSKDFDPHKYVKEVTSQCVGGTDLVGHKGKLQTVAEETNAALKRNVFQHYGQFIDTAKDISYLAGEMYQISLALKDQKALIQNLLDTNILGTKKVPIVAVTPTESDGKGKLPVVDENRKKLLGIIEKVEGAAEIIGDENRILLHEGDLLEIDPDRYSAVQRKRGYLFNDGIMLAVWVTSRRGPQRYKFQAFYELGGIGLVVNIKDPECPKHTFKLLIFPSVHLLQCPNQQEKDSWINQIEANQRILRNPSKGTVTKLSTLDSPTAESLPSFDVEPRSKSPEESLAPAMQSLPEWIVDIPEDLDVWIAQRNFSEAVNQYESFQEYLDNHRMNSNLKDIKTKVDVRIKTLIDILVNDLEIMTPEKILQGGPRSIRKSVDLLVRLGRESQACQLFLAHRSAFIKQRLKRLKTEGQSQLYLNHMARMFFNNIAETLKEHKRSFSQKIAETAGLVVWVNSEVSHFLVSYCRQLFGSQAHLSSVSNSIVKLRSFSQQMTEFGVDVSCTIDSVLLPHIERTVIDAKDKLVEAVRHRYRSPDDGGLKFADSVTIDRTLSELSTLGINDLRDVQSISNNAVAFAKSWLHFCNDVVALLAPVWQTLLERAICEVILIELKHLERSRKKINPKNSEVIDHDTVFILDIVCQAANRIYKSSCGKPLPELTAIVSEFAYLINSKDNKKPPVPAPRTQIASNKSNSRYTTPEFV